MSFVKHTFALTFLSLATVLPSHAANMVLVHGSWLDGSSWHSVYVQLVEECHTVSVVQLPLTSLEADIAATRSVLARQDEPVILVGQSYGGAVITGAGDAPNVAALVYVAAFQPDKGESVNDLLGKTAPAMPFDMLVMTDDGAVLLDQARFAQTLGGDVDPAQMAFLADAQTPTAFSAVTTPLSGAAWHDKPVWAVVATADQSISPDLQRLMYARSKATVLEVDASHMVILSQPAYVADIIGPAAKATE